MVLTLFLTIFFSHYDLQASSDLRSSELRKLEHLYKIGDYDELLFEAETLIPRSHPTQDLEVYEYQALALEKIGLYEEAIEIYRNLLQLNFKQHFSELTRRQSSDFLTDRRTRDKLSLYIVRMAYNYTQEFLQLRPNDETSLIDTKRSQALTFIRNSELFDENQIMASDLRKEVNDHLNYIQSFKIQRKYYLYTSFITWQYIMTLREISGTNRSETLTTASGTCTGGGIKWIDDYTSWDLESCFISATANTSIYNSGVVGELTEYNQNNTSVMGFYGGFGPSYYLIPRYLNLGLKANYFYNGSDFDPPEDYEIEGANFLRFGISAHTKARFGRLGIGFNAAKIFHSKSSLIQVTLDYYF